MREEIKNLWVEALRSGKFEQGHHVLKRERRDGSFEFCCLGVLTELAREAGVELSYEIAEVEETSGEKVWGYEDGEKECSYLLPPTVQKWAGMGTDDGLVEMSVESNVRISLTGMNDKGRTFKEIAQVIEENWERL